MSKKRPRMVGGPGPNLEGFFMAIDTPGVRTYIRSQLAPDKHLVVGGILLLASLPDDQLKALLELAARVDTEKLGFKQAVLLLALDGPIEAARYVEEEIRKNRKVEKSKQRHVPAGRGVA